MTVKDWNDQLYEDLLHELNEIELATQTVTPGPWHRVNSAVMKRVPSGIAEAEYLPIRAEGQERLVPDENFWDDVVMDEVHFIDLARKKGTGYIGNADRVEDAAHMARCDREFVLWLVKDYRSRLQRHFPESRTTRCHEDGADWPCEDARAVGRFIDQFHLE